MDCSFCGGNVSNGNDILNVFLNKMATPFLAKTNLIGRILNNTFYLIAIQFYL